MLAGMRKPQKIANYFSCALHCLLVDDASRQQLYQATSEGKKVMLALQEAARHQELVVSIQAVSPLQASLTCIPNPALERNVGGFGEQTTGQIIFICIPHVSRSAVSSDVSCVIQCRALQSTASSHC